PFSGFFLLPSQAGQIRCMRNVVKHLVPDGLFVFDAFVSDAGRYVVNQSVSLEDADAGHVRIEVARHDPIAQRIEATRVILAESGIKLYPYSVRYATPAELDAMATAAGLGLVDRFGGYDRRP